MSLDTISTIMFSLDLSIERAQKNKEQVKDFAPELVSFWESQITSFKDAREQISNQWK